MLPEAAGSSQRLLGLPGATSLGREILEFRANYYIEGKPLFGEYYRLLAAGLGKCRQV